MRLRNERRSRKRLRHAQHDQSGRELAHAVLSSERDGTPLEQALLAVATGPAHGWLVRGDAARILAIANPVRSTDQALRQFFSQEGREQLMETAMALGRAGNLRAVRPLVTALNDSNPDRRRAAAHALGCMGKFSGRAVRGLILAVRDVGQPADVREEAAESLAYLSSPRAIPLLISVLSDPEVQVRFWAVFALGNIRNRRTFRHSDPRVVPALELMLSDKAVPPGSWWPVGREALGMLGSMEPPVGSYRERMSHEIERVNQNPNASSEDRRWAGFYSLAIAS